MNFFNGWKSYRRNWDKIDLTLRLGGITLISIKADWSNKSYLINLLNMGIKSE